MYYIRNQHRNLDIFVQIDNNNLVTIETRGPLELHKGGNYNSGKG